MLGFLLKLSKTQFARPPKEMQKMIKKEKYGVNTVLISTKIENIDESRGPQKVPSPFSKSLDQPLVYICLYM